jgi:hypothetical protein
MLKVLFKFALPEVSKKRELICSTCEYKKTKVFDYCEKCSCSVKAKTILRNQNCPENKW